jgi:hypothetical protein
MRLAEAGVLVFATEAESVTAAVEAFSSAALNPASIDHACAGGSGACHDDEHQHH